MNKQKAIDKFIIDFQGQTFSEGSFVIWFRKRIASLVEEIYKEELEISDLRWQNNEKYKDDYYELWTEIENIKQGILKEIDLAIEQVHGGGNGRRLLIQLREKLE